VLTATAVKVTEKLLRQC